MRINFFVAFLATLFFAGIAPAADYPICRFTEGYTSEAGKFFTGEVEIISKKKILISMSPAASYNSPACWAPIGTKFSVDANTGQLKRVQICGNRVINTGSTTKITQKPAVKQVKKLSVSQLLLLLEKPTMVFSPDTESGKNTRAWIGAAGNIITAGVGGYFFKAGMAARRPDVTDIKLNNSSRSLSNSSSSASSSSSSSATATSGGGENNLPTGGSNLGGGTGGEGTTGLGGGAGGGSSNLGGG